MYCLKCGKEISDDSIFCYSCGLKVEIKEKQDKVTDTPPSIVNIETPPELQNTTLEINDQINKVGVSSITDKVENKKEQTISNQNNSNQGEEKKNKRGYGLLILLLFYGASISNWMKSHNTTDFSSVTTIVIILSLPLVIILYFQSRKILRSRKFFVNQVELSSFISGILSLMFVMAIIGFSTGIDQSSQGRIKIKEINEFAKSFRERTENLKKQELEYSKVLMSEPKTESELKDMILKVDEYKIFLMKKNENFMSLINFYRETNSKYKKDKSVDEQINKLEIINRDGFKTTIDSLDMLKKYLITGDEKYYKVYKQGYEKIQPLRDEVTQVMKNIEKSI